MSVTLVLTQVTTGALAGLLAALLLTVLRVQPVDVIGIGALAGLAGVADLARIRPLAVQRQVPQLWSRMFEPVTVALLYGARLGVGPLTILPTWSWWAAFLGAATHGPATAALVGAAFGATRGATSLAASAYAQRAMALRMARVRAGERVVRPLVAVASAAMGTAAILVS